MSVTPGYFYWKMEENWNQKRNPSVFDSPPTCIYPATRNLSDNPGTEMRIWIVPAFISYFAGNDCYKGITIYQFKLHNQPRLVLQGPCPL